jgi:hypothetical protein
MEGGKQPECKQTHHHNIITKCGEQDLLLYLLYNLMDLSLGSEKTLSLLCIQNASDTERSADRHVFTLK